MPQGRLFGFLSVYLVILGQNVRKTVIIANNDPIFPGTDPRNGTRTLESPQILIISRLRGQLISQSRKKHEKYPLKYPQSPLFDSPQNPHKVTRKLKTTLKYYQMYIRSYLKHNNTDYKLVAVSISITITKKSEKYPLKSPKVPFLTPRRTPIRSRGNSELH